MKRIVRWSSDAFYECLDQDPEFEVVDDGQAGSDECDAGLD